MKRNLTFNTTKTDDPEWPSGDSDFVSWQDEFQTPGFKEFRKGMLETDEIDGEVEPPSFLLQTYSDEKLIRELTTAHPDLCKQLYLVFLESLRQTRESILEF